MSFLADPALEGREAGSPAAQKAARWLAVELKQLGLAPASAPAATICNRSVTATLTFWVCCRAVIRSLAGPIVLLGAHFDHVGYNRRRKRDSQRRSFRAPTTMPPAWPVC